jgi:hypothetical protein
MELNTQAIEEFLSAKELEEVKAYFKTNQSGILEELAEIDQHIALRPLTVIFAESDEDLQRNYPSMSFSEEVKEDGSTGVYVELVK